MKEDQTPEEMPQETIQPDEQKAEQVEQEFVQEDKVEIGPAQQAQIDAYQDNATMAVFSEKTQPAILQSLQSMQNPIESLAQTAFTVHKQLETKIEATGEQMTEITMFMGAGHLVSELVVLAEAAGLYALEPEERLEAFRGTVMKYFEAGLKDGSIDPVELQKTIEPLMTEEQRAAGLQQMEKQGISKTAPPSAAGRRQQEGEML